MDKLTLVSILQPIVEKVKADAKHIRDQVKFREVPNPYNTTIDVFDTWVAPLHKLHCKCSELYLEVESERLKLKQIIDLLKDLKPSEYWMLNIKSNNHLKDTLYNYRTLLSMYDTKLKIIRRNINEMASDLKL